MDGFNCKLITDLLDMSRVLSGKMRLDVQRVEIPLAVESAIESMLPAAEAKGVRIEPTIEPHPGVIAGDPGRVQQIVWNLLSNAVKFTPRGGCVQVKVARKNQHVEVRVIDTGEGIAPSFLPHIFERFRQADASPSRPYGGLGIGLALVKQLVELHGGRVHATSDGLGKGATFVVELPIPAAFDGERNRMRLNPWAAAEVENRLPAHLQGINILVVEDEPDAQAMLRRVLEECQAAVSTALSSDHAFEILECERFDVIVSDIGMPGVDGYAFITKVRDRGIQTPAVALTAFARDEDRARAMAAGFQAHVSKPLVVSELFSVIACLVRPTDQESARRAG
jgi:CheY-like chemotaxis protein